MLNYRPKIDILDGLTEVDTMDLVVRRARQLEKSGGNAQRDSRVTDMEHHRSHSDFAVAQAFRRAMVPNIPTSSPCVYIVQPDGADGVFKIGMAQSLPSRMRSLQTGHYLKLRLIMAIYYRHNPAKTEALLHKEFYSQRIRGEWFFLSKSDIANIESNFQNRSIRYAEGVFEECD